MASEVTAAGEAPSTDGATETDVAAAPSDIGADAVDSGDEAGGSAGTGQSRWSGRLARAVLVLPSLILLERAWDRRWMTDDGFINLRVARMILDGHGPVFNVGERVEVTTSTLWVWMLVAGDVLVPLRMEWVAVVLGLACAVGGLLGATFGAVRLQRALGVTGPLVPAGALVLAVISPIWDFSTSGLEGGLTFGWLGLCTYLLGRWAQRDDGSRVGLLTAAVLGLGPLVRPDLVLISGVLVLGLLVAEWGTAGWSGRLRIVAAAGALPVAYEIFRMGYYASLVPNTALAKAAGRTRFGNGFLYLRDLVQPYWLFIPLLAVALGVLLPALGRARRGPTRRLVALVALPIGGVLDGLYVVAVGGDYMHGRLLLPALFALVAPFAAGPLPRWPGATAATASAATEGRTRSVLPAVAVGVTVVWGVVCLATLRPGEAPVNSKLFSSDTRQGTVRQYGEHPVTSIADLYRQQPWANPRPGEVWVDQVVIDVEPPATLPTPAHAGYGIGVGGYIMGSDVYVIDMLGLGDPVTSRFQLVRPGNTGHEKPMPFPWLAAILSTGPVDFEALPEALLAFPLYESPADQHDADTEAAREALRCGDLERLREAVSEPLTVGRFVDNLFAAPAFTLLDVPANPNAAVATFCD